jgi:hypothetical protein
MLRVLLIPIAFFLTLDACLGQRLMDRKRPEIIPLEGKVRRGGFYIGPGFTYTLPRDRGERELFNSADTSYMADHNPEGRFGLYLEAGWFHATRDPVLLDYWDVGLAYKNLRGYEEYTGLYTVAENGIPMAGEGKFAERYLSLHVNANKFIQVRDYQFIQVSLGANADYRLGADHEHTGDPLLNGHTFPPDLVGQLHFKLGYGFKLTGRLLMIPTVETPVFSLAPDDDGNWGALQWFSSTYRPLIFTLRLMWLRPPKGFDCPPVIRQPGEKKRRSKKYKPDGYHP